MSVIFDYRRKLSAKLVSNIILYNFGYIHNFSKTDHNGKI